MSFKDTVSSAMTNGAKKLGLRSNMPENTEKFKNKLQEEISEGRSFGTLKNSPSYQRLEDKLFARIEEAKKELVEVDVKDTNQVLRLQERVRATQGLISLVNDAIERGEKAAEKLTAMQKAEADAQAQHTQRHTAYKV